MSDNLTKLAALEKKIREMPDTDELSTFECATICQVAPRTICKWFDAGKLVGSRLPGGDRRIPRGNFLTFLRDNGFPTEFLERNQ